MILESQCLVWTLIYMTVTCPNISHAVNTVLHFMQSMGYSSLSNYLGIYQCLVWKFIDMTITLPNISYAINIVNQLMHDLRSHQLDAVNCILQSLELAQELRSFEHRRLIWCRLDQITKRQIVNWWPHDVCWRNFVTWKSNRQYMVAQA